MNEEILSTAVEAVTHQSSMKHSHWYSNFPRWLKALLLIVSIVTLVYWIGFIIYKILWIIQKVVSFLFHEKHYWIFLTSILVGSIVAVIVCQSLGLDIIGKIEASLIEFYENFKNTVIVKIEEWLK